MPYGYYQFTRFTGMAGFILLGYFDAKKENKALFVVWICSAILINPIIKIALGRIIWNIMDVIWAVLLIFTLIYDFISRKK